MSAPGKAEDRSRSLGRYELVTPIARGGMAEVHLAIHHGPAGFEKLVVVKLVHDQVATQKPFVDMLLDEAKLAAQIKHPNVVDIYELGEHDGRYFIAMEYLEGEPLLELLRIGGDGHRLDPLSTARVIADAAEGLDAAHRLRSRDGRSLELVHHDVSLGNIVVLYTGQVKLVDFGVAKAAEHASAHDTVQGKFGYMAPEKLQQRAVDRRSDIWSLGCVLWEALTLRRLFRGDTDAETVRQVLELAIEPPSKVDPSVPPAFDPIVARAVQRDPDRRYQTAKALASDLEEVLRDQRYGGKNDRIAQYMEVAFADRILARQQVLQDVSSRRRPSAEIIEQAFADGRALASTTSAPPPAPADPPPAPAAQARPDADERPAAPDPGGTPTDAEGAPAEPRPRTARIDPPDPISAPVPTSVLRDTTTGARSRRGSIAPTHFVIPAPREPAPDPEPLLRPSPLIIPSAPVPSAPVPFELPRFDLPPLAPLGPSAADPFGDDGETIADMIPAFPEVSRSPRSDPSWAVSRHGSSLGQLQTWVQETRDRPASRAQTVKRRLARTARRIEHRWASIARRRGLPRWVPLPIAGVLVVVAAIAIARCGGSDPGDAARSSTTPPPLPRTATVDEPAGSAADPDLATAPVDPEIEMTADVVTRPPRPPGSAPALYRDGLDALRRGDPKAALAALTRARRVDPNYPPVWYGLGLVYERLGRRGAAKAAYQRYLALAPRAANAAQIRAQIERI